MQTIVYFPHLHSFTKRSFACLLEGNGYEVVDDSMTKKKELFFLARKTDKINNISTRSEDSIAWVKNRFANVLGFEKNHCRPRCRGS